jgi:hypothetical protein
VEGGTGVIDSRGAALDRYLDAWDRRFVWAQSNPPGTLDAARHTAGVMLRRYGWPYRHASREWGLDDFGNLKELSRRDEATLQSRST